MKLDSDNIKRFKVVDLTNCRDMEGVTSADDETGECIIETRGETKNMKFEPGSFRVVRRF